MQLISVIVYKMIIINAVTDGCGSRDGDDNHRATRGWEKGFIFAKKE